GGGPNGAAVGPDGRLYVCQNGGFTWTEQPNGIVFPGAAVGRGGNTPPDYEGGGIQVVDLETGAVEDLYMHVDGNRLAGPNDIVFDADGGFWFSDAGKRRERTAHNSGLYYA